MSSLIFLGTRSSYRSDRFKTVSIILTLGNNNFLIDCNASIVSQLYAANINPANINNVFISHSHGDHTLGFPYLMFFKNLNMNQGISGSPVVSLYSTSEIIAGLLSMTEFCYNDFPTYAFRVERIPVSPTHFDRREIPGLGSLLTAPVDHTTLTLGCRLELQSPALTIAYSSDTLPCDNLLKLADRADILIQEAMFAAEKSEIGRKTKHATGRQAGEIASKAKVKRLFLVHVHPSYGDDVQQLKNEAEELFSGEITVPDDLHHVNLEEP